MTRSFLSVAVVFLLGAALPSGVLGADWQQQEASSLTFVALYDGGEFEGRFENFDTRITLDPEQPDGGCLQAVIRIVSVNTENEERDDALVGNDWFTLAKYPEARFVTTGIRHLTDHNYVADARLTIRDMTRELRFPFTFDVTGDAARLQAEVTLNRLDYHIGQGDWADDDLIGYPVRVRVDLHLQRGQ